MKSALLFTTALVAGLALGAPARAVVVAGSTNGSLSNLTNCNNPNTCQLTSSNQLLWGANVFGQVNSGVSSILGMFDGAINDADGIDVSLGSLTWTNRSTPDNQTDDSFNVNWSLADTFTAPSGSGTLSNLTLNIQNTLNPQGDLIVNFNPAAFSSNVPGYTVSNLEIVVSGGATYSNGMWSNAEGNTSTLTLRGDFVPNAVPEPMSMSLLGMGLVGLGLIRFRKRPTGGQQTA